MKSKLKVNIPSDENHQEKNNVLLLQKQRTLAWERNKTYLINRMGRMYRIDKIHHSKGTHRQSSSALLA
jgi:hypothetical protein